MEFIFAFFMILTFSFINNNVFVENEFLFLIWMCGLVAVLHYIFESKYIE